jgi:hypothetical protein
MRKIITKVKNNNNQYFLLLLFKTYCKRESKKSCVKKDKLSSLTRIC